MREYKLSNFLIDKYIMAALEEDINWEDITTNSVIGEEERGWVDLIAKEDGVLAGIDVF